MRALPPKTVLLNVNAPIAAMFFGAHAAYAETWPAEELQRVEALGYRVEIARCGADGLPPGFCTADRQ